MDVDGAVVEVDDPAFTVGAYRIPLRPRVDAEIGTYEGSIPIGPGPLEAQMGLRVRGPSLPDGAQAPEGELPSLHWRSAQDLIQDSTGALRVEWESGGGPANDSTYAGSWLLTVEPSDPGPPGAPRRRLVMQGQGPPPRPLDIGAAFVPGAGPWRVRLEITETRRDLRDAWEFRGTTRSQLIWIAQPASAAP
ncbi:MAG: hypothetical protein KC645_17895 [Gemmatimonadetes bacterium]|nr:hypothetical protein [Gemmatimonadota bacterium]